MNKLLIYTITTVIGILFTTSCADFEVESPKASFNTLKAVEGSGFEESSTFMVGEDVYVQNTGTGEMFTVYTGDTGHDGSSPSYTDDGVEKINTGFTINHPREETFFKYSYSSPGTYTIKVIAISTEEEGDVILEDSTTKEVNIVEP